MDTYPIYPIESYPLADQAEHYANRREVRRFWLLAVLWTLAVVLLLLALPLLWDAFFGPCGFFTVRVR